MAKRIFITVAEISGDRHAAQLVRSLKAIDPTLEISGYGGPDLAAEGVTIHRDMVAKAAMGVRGAFRAFEVYRLLRWTRRHFIQHRPDLWIGVDSPSMNFHFASVARDMGIPTLQYVAPQLWAWAPWRMKKVRQRVDRLACILPFEEQYFRNGGVNADYVGHPLFDELPRERRDPAEVRYPERPPVIGLLPGSRRGEAQANFPGLLEAAEQIRQAFPKARFLVPVTPGTEPVVRTLYASDRWKALASAGFETGLNQFDAFVPRCDLCLTVSGTATLHVAAFGVPMIVVYRASKVLWKLAGQWLVPTRTFALVNVLAERRAGCARGSGHIVPEFVPWFGSGSPIAETALDLLRNPGKLHLQTERLGEVVDDLDRPGASNRVAEMALEMTKSIKANMHQKNESPV